MNKYPLGTSVQVKATFTDLTGAAFDPDSVVCIIQQPDLVETAYTFDDDDELVKDSVGNYHLWVLGDQSGQYGYRFKGDGTHSVANEGKFYVDPSAFASP